MPFAAHRLTGFQRDLLYPIAGVYHPSGKTVKEELEDYFGRDISQGQLYPNLDSLVETDLVAKGQIDRRANFYDLTSNGREALTRRREWENQHLGAIITAGA